MSEHQFEHVEAALEHAGVRPRPPQNAEAAVFADLSGCTQLTEESGDEVAVRFPSRLHSSSTRLRHATGGAL